jgi:hypothetical protein
MRKTTDPLPHKSQTGARQFPGAAAFPLKTIWVSRGRLRSSVEAFSDDQIQLLVKSRNSLGSRPVFIEFR